MRRVLASGLLVLSLAACAGGAARQSPDAPRRGSRSVLTAEEIATIQVPNAYEAVQRLRPEFLRVRGVASARSGSPEPIRVIVDQVRVGGIEALASITASDVQEIRFLSAQDATTRYGTGNTSGAIEVVTRAGARPKP